MSAQEPLSRPPEPEPGRPLAVPTSPLDGLVRARNGLLAALADALEAGVKLADCLTALGVEGRPAIMVRAFLHSYSDTQLAVLVRDVVDGLDRVEPGS